MFDKKIIIIIFVLSLIHLVFNTNFTNAIGFDKSYSLRGGLMTINEGGFFIDVMSKIKKCIICGEKFSAIYEYEDVCYKRKCRKLVRRKKIKDRPIIVKTKICTTCGREFNTIHNHKTCHSKHCGKDILRNRKIASHKEIIKCVICNKPMIKKSKAHKYCSKRCIKKGGKIKYKKNKKLNYYEIFKRDGFRCMYCGKTPKEDGVKLVIDHIIPIAKGGKSEPQNMITSCSKCNSYKGIRLISKQLIIDFWNYCDNNSINYDKFKKNWEKKDKYRAKGLKKKHKNPITH